ncbi:hypothetical protein GCM10027033_05560 [Leucobacter ruminantium]
MGQRGKPRRQGEGSARARESHARKGGRAALTAWLVVALVLGAIFGLGPLVRYLKAPAISEGFGIEDAVVALRLDARDISYLVLVNEAGETRSVRLDERGFENSRLVWSSNGLSTGDPGHEYVLHEHGLTEIPLPGEHEGRSEWSRTATDTGFAVMMSSPQRPEIAFVDAASGTLSRADTDYAVPALAGCDGQAVMVGPNGVETVTPETEDFAGLGLFDGVTALACDADRAYGLGEISDGSPSAQALRVWDRETGEMGEVELRYPDSVGQAYPETPFVREGRLYWAADWRLWSVRLPDAAERPVVGDDRPVAEVELAAELSGFVDDYDPVVGIGEGVLAQAGGRVYGVAADEEFVNPSKGPSYDRLEGLAIFGIDTVTGERRVEIEVDDIDFPKRDLHVHAIAVDPEWAASR